MSTRHQYSHIRRGKNGDPNAYSRIDDLNIKIVFLHKKIEEQSVALKYILSKLNDIDATLSAPSPIYSHTTPRKSNLPSKRKPTRHVLERTRYRNLYNSTRSRSDSSTTTTSSDTDYVPPTASSSSVEGISRFNASDSYELEPPADNDLLPEIIPVHHQRRRPSKTVGAISTISKRAPYCAPVGDRLGYSTAKPHNAEIPTHGYRRTSSTSVQAPVYP